MNDFWAQHIMGNTARTLAFCLVIGTLIGSTMPEFGNILAVWLEMERTHYFNKWFLATGILGILGFGLALHFRLSRG